MFNLHIIITLIDQLFVQINGKLNYVLGVHCDVSFFEKAVKGEIFVITLNVRDWMVGSQ